MDINDVHQQMQDAIQTARLTKPVWQGLLDVFKRRRNLQSNEPVDNQELVRGLLRENARDTVESLELTTEAAFHILGPGFESEDVLDPTWQKRWIAGVTNVSADDEERRTWWARLLGRGNTKTRVLLLTHPQHNGYSVRRRSPTIQSLLLVCMARSCGTGNCPDAWCRCPGRRDLGHDTQRSCHIGRDGVGIHGPSGIRVPSD